MVAVQHHQEGGVFAAPADAGRLGAAVHQHAKTFHAHVAPFLGFHLGARGVDPGHVLDAQLLVIDASQKPGAPQDRVLVAQCRQLLHKADQRLTLFADIPVDPADLVILAIGVVVALLGSRKLVAGEQHRCALRQQQSAEEVAPLTGAQRIDVLVVGRAFDPAIPRAVVGVAVLVVLAVRLVVPLVVGDQIVEREPVMGGDEIDAGPGLAAAVVENVARGAKARSERARRGLAAPEIAHRIAEFVVPLGPARREATHLISARTAIPRLGDQLDRAQLRVLAAGLEEPALIIEPAGLAGENRAEVEAKAVDMRLARPIAQTVGDHLDHPHVVEVERVPGSRVVYVITRVVGQQPIIRGVVDALERQGRAELVAFGSMIVHDVENDFETGLVKARHHLLEFAQGLLALVSIARVGREKPD